MNTKYWFDLTDEERVHRIEEEVARDYNKHSTIGHGDICFCVECCRYRLRQKGTA